MGRDYGGGVLVRKVELSEKAAQWLKERATILGPRYRKEEASEAASNIFELIADGRAVLLPLSPDLLAALPWLEEAKGICVSEDAQRGLAQLIAALWVARNKS